MNKFLLTTSALIGFSAVAIPAQAEMNLNLGGYFAGYGVFSDNDIANRRGFDLRRDTEVHVTGETALDNGLTVGFHTEQALGRATQTNEAYLYFSNRWGRVNLGSEDGAAYLLQVAAPSADSNIDGLRTYIQGLASESLLIARPGTSAPFSLGFSSRRALDYGLISDTEGPNTDRLTYLSPKLGGFQVGFSFAPEASQNEVGNNIASPSQSNQVGLYENIWEAAARWDGNFGDVVLSVGAGYSDSSLQHRIIDSSSPVIGHVASGAPVDIADGVEQWQLGGQIGWQAFSLGAAWRREHTINLNGIDIGSSSDTIDRVDELDADRDTLSLGMAWDQGPYHLGASWFQQRLERESSGRSGVDDGALQAFDGEIHRYTLGGGYTLAPGMSVRAAFAWGDFDNDTRANIVTAGVNNKNDSTNLTGVSANNNNFTQVTLGTQINF